MYVHRQENSLSSHVFYLTPRPLLFPGCLLCTRHLTPFHPSLSLLELAVCSCCIVNSAGSGLHMARAIRVMQNGAGLCSPLPALYRLSARVGRTDLWHQISPVVRAD